MKCKNLNDEEIQDSEKDYEQISDLNTNGIEISLIINE
jgi:hypothetical protein